MSVYQPEPQQKKWMLTAIAVQATGMHGALAFRNSLLLLYMLSLGLSQTLVIAYLAVLGIGSFIRLPVAYLSDKWGKKLFGTVGNISCVIGFIIISLAGFSKNSQTCAIVLLCGIITFTFGDALFGAAWVPMLRPIVPSSIRGRFLGRLRISWQLAGLLFSGIAALMLGSQGHVAVYQAIMGTIALLLAFRCLFFNHLPELEKNRPQSKQTFFVLLGKLLRQSGYASFAAYIFLLMIFTANTPNIFSMIEREVMKLTVETVIWLANIGLLGALTGYYIGGSAVDKFSAKPIFFICHFGYAMFSLLFLLRGVFSGMMLPLLGICHFSFGFVYAASSIAITTEIMALMPKSNQALANSILTTMLFLGIGGSSLLCAGMLKLNFLKTSWTLWGYPMSNYDAMLLGNGVMITILITALGLVPSVIRNSKVITKSIPS